MESFLNSIRNDHHQFDSGKLEDHFDSNPNDTIARWLREAIEKPANEPNAMSVSTVDSEGFPRSRIVYLKELVEDGLIFYTNYSSFKGNSIEGNNKVHVLIFWPELERQISISGFAEKVPDEMNDLYFESRPYGSKIGAWASHQSEILSSRQELEDRVNFYVDKFPLNVPRPPHWGGYLVKPTKIEFWQGRPSRLHDRIVYMKNEKNWKMTRLNP